jgi:hypothetical protein
MQTLEQWLDAATRGLSGSAATRVRAEIGEHYASALESAVAVGIDSIEAERRAVAELGDAKTANREYRRVLLTQKEADLLRDSTFMAAPHHWIGVLLWAAMVVYAVSVRNSAFIYFIAWCAIEPALRSVRISSIRTGWIVRVCRWVAVAACYASLINAAPEYSRNLLTLVSSFVFVIGAHVHMEYRLFVIRRKLPIEQWPRRLWV